MTIVWILSYLAVFFIGVLTAVAAIAIVIELEMRKGKRAAAMLRHPSSGSTLNSIPDIIKPSVIQH